MYRIKTLNKISSVGLNQFDKTRFQVGADVAHEIGRASCRERVSASV